MARGPNTARARLQDDKARWIGLVLVGVVTTFAVTSTWPREVSNSYYGTDDQGSWVGPIFWILIGGLVVAGTARGLWLRCQPLGPHWHDRWQARQGELVDLVLSAAKFRGDALNRIPAEGVAGAGWGVAQNGAAVANVPGIGGLGGPLTVVGLAVMAAAAAVGVGQAVVQSRRDEAATKVFRGAARAQLVGQRAILESQRATARGRRLSRLDADLTRNRDAIARIERMGFADVTP